MTLKSIRLINGLANGAITGAALQTLLSSDATYLNAWTNRIAALQGRLAYLTASPTAMSSVFSASAAVAPLISSAAAMTDICTTPAALSALIASTPAITSVLASAAAMGILSLSPAAASAVLGSPISRELFFSGTLQVGNTLNTVAIAGGAVSNANNQALVTKMLLADVAASASSMAAIVGSASVMAAVAASPIAMTAMAASSTAMAVIAGNPVSMAAVSASSVAMGIIAASKAAFETYVNASSSVGLGLDTLNVAAGNVTSTALKASATIAAACANGNLFATTAALMRPISLSPTAINAFFVNSSASATQSKALDTINVLNGGVSNATLVNAGSLSFCLTTSAQMAVCAASAAIMNALLLSTYARGLIYNSDVALGAIAASAVAKTAMRAAPTYQVLAQAIGATTSSNLVTAINSSSIMVGWSVTGSTAGNVTLGGRKSGSTVGTLTAAGSTINGLTTANVDNVVSLTGGAVTITNAVAGVATFYFGVVPV